MDLQDFNYDLPKEAIARYPANRRTDSRLMVLPRYQGPFHHKTIRDLPEELKPGDLLVVNDTKVQSWRLFGKRTSGGKVEVLLLREDSPGVYQAMISSNHPLPEGERIRFQNGMDAVLGAPGLERQIRFLNVESFYEWLELEGELPIPPYLGRRAETIDYDRYQTVFARVPGAVAAPTAGLHFDDGLISKLKSKGVNLAPLTLHVGPGTFRPVKQIRVENHKIDAETYILPQETANRIEETRRNGGRVIAVGTTVVRVLESVAMPPADGLKSTGCKLAGETSLFIRPGHTFRAIDGIVTNFHLPFSTLLILVAAFAGRKRILKAYRAARDADYRFYSYGDAMFIT